MVRPVEFESTTTGLKGRCSTVELRTHLKNRDKIHHLSPQSTIFPKKSLAPEEGFEPPTLRLTAACSTIELLWNADYTIHHTQSTAKRENFSAKYFAFFEGFIIIIILQIKSIDVLVIFFDCINCAPLGFIFILINKLKCIIYSVIGNIWLHMIYLFSLRSGKIGCY